MKSHPIYNNKGRFSKGYLCSGSPCGNTVMKTILFFVSLVFFELFSQSSGQRTFNRGFKFSVPTDVSESIDQRLFGVPYGEPAKYVYRNSEEERREVGMEARPLCEEERKSLNIRELIHSSNSNFLQSGTNVDLRKYNLIPRKVDVIRCVSKNDDDKSEAVCKPENCRERKVDVEVFGRLKNETGNVWEFVGTLSAVPVACECFVRWKPEKCSRSVDVFSDF